MLLVTIYINIRYEVVSWIDEGYGTDIFNYAVSHTRSKFNHAQKCKSELALRTRQTKECFGRQFVHLFRCRGQSVISVLTKDSCKLNFRDMHNFKNVAKN